MMLTLILARGASATELPPPGLLEYLGSMVESDGQLVDPLALTAIPDDADTEPMDTSQQADPSEIGAGVPDAQPIPQEERP